MFPHLDRQHTGNGVRVIGRGNHHRIYVPGLLFQHPAKVFVAPRFGILRIRIGRSAIVNIAQSDDVLLMLI